VTTAGVHINELNADRVTDGHQEHEQTPSARAGSSFSSAAAMCASCAERTKMNIKIKHLTGTGHASFPNLDRPDPYYSERGVVCYTLSIQFDSNDAMTKALLDQIDALCLTAFGANAAQAHRPIKREGEVVTLRLKSRYKPPVLDRDNKPMEQPVNYRDQVRARITLIPYTREGMFGVTASMDIIQFVCRSDFQFPNNLPPIPPDQRPVRSTVPDPSASQIATMTIDAPATSQPAAYSSESANDAADLEAAFHI
jgi:hypothetical protein